jgi:2-isopropylmalate synthase
LDKDIDRAGEALKGAQTVRESIPLSPRRRFICRMKLRMSPDQVIEHAVRAVKRARQYTDNVEFSPEDAGRSEEDFLCRILEAVIDAGATTLEYS